MPINHDEIIEEIEGHIRKFEGGFGEWCVGTAKDSRGPFFRRHLAADLGDGLAYREAFTTTAAQAVVDHLVNDRGLAFDRDSVPEPGKIVFVYRQARDTGYGRLVSGLGIRAKWELPRPRPPAIMPRSPGAPHRAWLPTAQLRQTCRELYSGWPSIRRQLLRLLFA